MSVRTRALIPRWMNALCTGPRTGGRTYLLVLAGYETRFWGVLHSAPTGLLRS